VFEVGVLLESHEAGFTYVELLERLSSTSCREGGEATGVICSGGSGCFGSLVHSKGFQAWFRFGGISSRVLGLVSGGAWVDGEVCFGGSGRFGSPASFFGGALAL
jgi:hypothetical protein